ncbi:c-type cytochrome [Jannaschia sp. 2305UL9-9]|uniref:c-type cytochrome n=1 Tax=Jannaschia sp. 2305UL9-9 TaxID=3121638 RepID=UPI00352706BD
MRRLVLVVSALVLIGGGAVIWLTRATPLPPESIAGLPGDAARGEDVFWVAGCASCHAADGAEGAARLILTGGQRFPSDFGTFVAPNVSTHPEAGIGDWTFAEFANAVQRGVSPEGAHYYPAFPYTAYALAAPQDIADLWAFWQGLPAADTVPPGHDVGFPFSLRSGVGVWKALFAQDGFQVDADDPEVLRGRYLVEALGHCAECHTPRTALGGLDRSQWMAGAPDPGGSGRVPGLTPATLTWSQDEIAQYLNDGFTPDFDSVGGHMVSVVRNLAETTEADRRAIAAYLKALPPRP